MKCCAAMIILTTLVLFSVASWADAQTGPVTFTVDEARIELGEVKAGTDAVATFTFHNRGDEDVTIIRAKPS